MSRVRRLVSKDAEAHAAPEQSAETASTPDDADPLSLLGLMDDSETATGVAPESAANDAEEGEGEDARSGASEEGAGQPGAVAAPPAPQVVTLPAPELVDGERTETMDVIASLAPILRAVQVFPGPTASGPQLIESIQMLSRDSVRLADMLARATDDCEIDVAWRRRRSGVMVADLVANFWISTVITNQGVAIADMWQTEGFARIATAFCAAADIAHESETLRSGPVDIHAIVLGLAPVHIDLQRTAEHMKRLSPESEIDVESAALAIAVTASEEVASGAGRLQQELPQGASFTALAAELMAAVGPMAQAAWDAARGEMYARLKAAEHDQEAQQQLIEHHLQGGLPVKDTCERLRVLVRRLVSMSVYAAKAVAGENA